MSFGFGDDKGNEVLSPVLEIGFLHELGNKFQLFFSEPNRRCFGFHIKWKMKSVFFSFDYNLLKAYIKNQRDFMAGPESNVQIRLFWFWNVDVLAALGM